VVAGDPIRDPAVVFAKGSGFMAAILPQGMRAVSVGVTAESSAGGFILPDDHVDILLTHREKNLDKNSTGEKFVTDTILRNVPVLAVDQAVAEKNGEKVVIGKTATLELMPAQAETLAHARQIGTLSLSLRSILDSQSSTPEGAEHKEDAPSINTVRYGVSSLTFSP
jgi:pilus assembly protein CpaB